MYSSKKLSKHLERFEEKKLSVEIVYPSVRRLRLNYCAIKQQIYLICIDTTRLGKIKNIGLHQAWGKA